MISRSEVIPAVTVKPEDMAAVESLGVYASFLLGHDVDDIKALSSQLPGYVNEYVDDFVSEPNDFGFILINGLPVGELPPTPFAYGASPLPDGHVSSGVMALVAERLGQLFGYSEEKQGATLQEVHPVKGEETRLENSGSVAFDFHTENSHHPFRPDYLALLGMRTDHDRVGVTRVSSVRRAVRLLDTSTVRTLRKPIFQSLFANSFIRGSSGEHPKTHPHSVVFGASDKPLIRFNSHHTGSDEPEGRKALHELTAALEEVCVDLLLEPGQMVVVDNHVAVHGRSNFKPRYDGEDRWLRRFYSIQSIPRALRKISSNERVLPRLDEISTTFS